MRCSLLSPRTKTLSAARRPQVPSTRARRAAGRRLVHLPTWSQLSIATRQRGPVGHGGDFFEIIQHREGHVSALLADVCGNGPSAAVPVSRLRWLVRQHLACGESPGAVLALLNDAIVAGNEPDLFVTAVCVQIDPQSGAMTRRQRRPPRAVHQARLRRRAGAGRSPTGAALGIMPGADLRRERSSTWIRRTRSSWSPTASPIRWARRRARSARPDCSPSSRARVRPPNRSARRCWRDHVRSSTTPPSSC